MSTKWGYGVMEILGPREKLCELAEEIEMSPNIAKRLESVCLEDCEVSGGVTSVQTSKKPR